MGGWNQVVGIAVMPRGWGEREDGDRGRDLRKKELG